MESRLIHLYELGKCLVFGGLFMISNFHKKAIVVFYLITIIFGIISLGFFYVEKPYRVSQVCDPNATSVSDCVITTNSNPTNLMGHFINATIVTGSIFLALSVLAFYDKRKYPEDYAKPAPVLELVDTNVDVLVKTTEPTTYFHGFDYLRVILCIFVVALHTGILGWALFIVPTSGVTSITLKDIVFVNIFYVAVPAFLLLSLFLYVHNMKNKIGYFRKRVVYLVTIYIFWSLIYMGLSDGGITVSKLLDARYIISGGNLLFGLPYFLFDLILLIIITEGLLYVKQKVSERVFLITNAILIGITSLYFVILPVLSTAALPIDPLFIVSGSSLLNYLAYPSIVLLLYHYYSNGYLSKVSWKVYAVWRICNPTVR
jgi:hypothetical protein